MRARAVAVERTIPSSEVREQGGRSLPAEMKVERAAWHDDDDGEEEDDEQNIVEEMDGLRD